MGIRRLENVAIVVDDLAAVVAFFVDLGLTEVGAGTVEGDWVGDVVGLDGVRSQIVMLEPPGGGTQLEITKYHHPEALPGDPQVPPNTLGLHRVAFSVDDIDESVAVARRHGAEPLRTIARFEDAYRLCYLRHPEGIIVMLAEPLG